jgi:hypothetical protein
METNAPYKIRVGKINSLDDLEREKERLQLEIVRKEEGIKYSYQSMVHLLSFRNIMTTLIDEVSTTTTVIGKIFSLGKEFLAKRKKKAKHEQQEKHETGTEEQAE